MIRSFGIIILIGVLSSCMNDKLVSEEFTFPNEQWITGDTKAIMIHAPDTTQAYQMNIQLEHLTNYGYQNLYIKTVTVFPSGKEVSSITSLELANPDGTWSGECGGKKCTLSLPLHKGFTFPETGQYSWQIEPYMRVDTIMGIERIKIECKILKD